MTSGGRNLVILGVGSVILAVVSTTVSLAIYRISGDIYLDRSRPGFLPDEDEVKEEPQESTNFSFSDSGSINRESLEEYLDELQKIINRLDNFADPFSPSPLSDQSLGIPEDEFDD